jgi:hypothetical protein
MAHTCNPSDSGSRDQSGGPQFKARWGKKKKNNSARKQPTQLKNGQNI